MRYEIDFIATKENKGNADAICFRYEKDSKFINVVYDGGSKVLANKLIEHLEEFYFKNDYYPKIHYLICSHPDQDHASGLIEVIEKFEIGKIIMNIPWNYIDDIWDNINDRRISKESLEKRLKDDYPYVAEIEKLAKEKGIEIIEGFEDKQINENLKILSPSKEFFIELLKKSKKTKYLDESDYKSNIYTESAKNILSKFTNWIKELWGKDSLKEDVETSEENEMSIVLLGDMEENKFLLTGDVGLKGLEKAIEKGNKIGIPLTEVNFYQIPHHGSRHNLSPSIMNKMVGNIVSEGIKLKKVAYASVAYESDYPRKAVVNAFIRRGVQVYKTDGYTITYSHLTSERAGWSSISELSFNEKVEDWDK